MFRANSRKYLLRNLLTDDYSNRFFSVLIADAEC